MGDITGQFSQVAVVRCMLAFAPICEVLPVMKYWGGGIIYITEIWGICILSLQGMRTGLIKNCNGLLLCFFKKQYITSWGYRFDRV